MAEQPESEITLLDLSERLTLLEKRFEQAIMLLGDLYRYDTLKELLAAGKWKEADLETRAVMLEIAGQNDHDNLTPDDVMLFPCSAIRLIDKLWLKFSEGRFGFSLQREVYTNLGGTDDISQIDLKVLEQTGDRLGWRQNNQWTPYDSLDFSLSSPPGCHPSAWWRSPYGAKMAVYFLSRLMRCHV